MRSPYDPSAEEAFFRNEKRLKEELLQFEKNCSQIERVLKEVGIEEEKVSKKIDSKRLLPKQGWVRI